MTDSKNISQRAFTLIELSIVLVIIGLVVGGVLVGRDMIRQSEIRSVESDIARFGSAVNTFLGKYNALPGDMKNATDYFGTDSGGCPSGGGATGTCNGDDNRQIGAFNFGTACCIDLAEAFRFWQHLASAGLVAGKFSGIAGPLSARQMLPGTNIPPTRLALTSGYGAVYSYGPGGQTDRFRLEAGAHYWWIGSVPDPNGVAYENSGPLLTATETKALDIKIDDGLPASGTMTSLRAGGMTSCVTSADPLTAVYNTGYKNPACSIQIKAPF